MSNLRRYIRPNRDDVIRWYVRIVMLALVFLSDDISFAIVDVVNVESGIAQRWINFSIDVIAMLAFVRFVPFGQPPIAGEHPRLDDRKRSRVIWIVAVILVVWSALILDVVHPSPIAQVLLVVTPFVAVIAATLVLLKRSQTNST